MSNKWLVGSLSVAIVLMFGLLVRGRSQQATTLPPVTSRVQAEARPVIERRVDAQQVDDTGQVDICGFGKVPIDRTDPLATAQYIGALTKRAGARWLSELRDSGDLRARVAGLLLEGKVTGDEPMRPVAEQTRDAVVQLAAGGEDPAVYAIAVSMCGNDAGTKTNIACQHISLQGWAQIDPDNAVPWLLLAGKARDSHNGAAEADAFRRAAKAHKVDSYNDSLYTFAEPEMPKDVTPLERAYLATEVIGIEAAIRAPQYSVAAKHCSVDAVQDSDVLRQCDSLAELLVSKGTTLLDLAIGKRIGARVGWPIERVNSLEQEQSALMQVITEATPSDSHDLWTCSGVRRVNVYIAQRSRLGELGAARDALERSGETEQAMAKKYTQFLDTIRRDAFEKKQAQSAEPIP